jgi:hypothetical protein
MQLGRPICHMTHGTTWVSYLPHENVATMLSLKLWK